MATVINNPSGGDDSSVGVIVGIVAIVLLVILFFVYALPAIRGTNASAPAQTSGAQINVTLPGGNASQSSSAPAPAY